MIERQSPSIFMTIPDSVIEMFRDAGWHAGRRVTVPKMAPPDHPAYDILAQFGELHVGECHAGEECATGDIQFMLCSPNSNIDEWSKLLSTRLVGVAGVHRYHGELYMSETGIWFHFSDIDGEMCYLADSFGAAVERLLLGRRLRPMLRPEQSEIYIYGERIVSDDPRIYHY
jgi:hypothetical protein